jgi:hypothetical protein
MKKILLLFACLGCISAQAQMISGADTLYGNEWLHANQLYLKIKVAKDGLYRISAASLQAAGWPSVSGAQCRLYHNGQLHPIFVSTPNTFDNQDFIEFFGAKNRDELDRFLYDDPSAEALNPEYSLYNDTAAYFLTLDNSTPGAWVQNVNNDLNNLPPAEAYVWYRWQTVFSEQLYKKQISKEITFSWFDGLGFGKNGTETTTPLTPTALYTNGPEAQLGLRYACNLLNHQQQIWLGNTLLSEDVFSNARILQKEFSLPANTFTNTPVLTLKTVLGNTDDHTLSRITLDYPRLPQADNSGIFTCAIDGNGNKQYLEIQGFNTTSGAPLLYAPALALRLSATVDNGLVRIALPPTTGRHTWVLIAPDQIETATGAPKQFRDFSTENPNYLLIYNQLLNTGTTQHVSEYAAYRSSAAGGNYRVTLAEIEELYDQFAYGVRFHPLSVRNFLHFMKKKFPAIEHALLVGKGLEHADFRDNTEQSTLYGAPFFLPSIGAPAADQLYAMATNRLSKPILSIGRLAASKPADVAVYLQKVKDHDFTFTQAAQTIGDKAWMKRVLHNSGGLAGETEVIKNHTSGMANLLSNNRFGADVRSFYKTVNDPIQLAAYEQILKLVNEGVSIWTIFGHSSSTAVDFDIGTPAVYNNQGKYPYLLVMGCFSGRCSGPNQGIGESFLLAPNRGVVAYMASVNFSFVDALNDYGVQYYNQLGGADYGNTIGNAYLHTVDALKNTQNLGLVAVMHQNQLQGDPALRLYNSPGPDYIIDPQSVQFDPNPVSVEQGNVQVKFDVLNLGENLPQDLALTLQQQRPGAGTPLLRLRDTVPAPAFRSSFSYQVPVNGSTVGFNRFFLTLDPDNTLAEQPLSAELNNQLTENNGQAGIPVFFFANDIAPVYPPDFGVWRGEKVTLSASTLNTGASEQRYLWELDTLETFDSPFKKQHETTVRGGLLQWQPEVPLQDSVVYYWRVARDSLVDGQVVWRQRSFIRLAQAPAGTEGWNQSHFGQWTDNSFVNAQLSDTARVLAFADNAAFMNINVAHRNSGVPPGLQNNFYDGFYGNSGWNFYGVGPGIALMLLNPNTGRVMLNPANGPFNPYGPADILVYYFRTSDSLQRVGLMNFIKNEVPTGTVVAMLAFHDPNDTLGYAPRKWAADSLSYGQNLFQILEAQGAKEVRNLTQYNHTPPAYGLIFKKNTPAFGAIDTTVNTPGVLLPLRKFYLIKWANGFMESQPVGPVKAWKSLHWNPQDYDNSSDLAQLELFGVREGQADTLLYTLGRQTPDTSIAWVSAAQFPQLKLRFTATDTIERSAVQPRWMRILYEGLPEGALHPAAYFNFYADTLEQGETLRSSVAFVNISQNPMDSLLLRLRLENAQGGNNLLQRRAALAPGDSLHIDYQKDTRNMQGAYRWSLEVNPNNDQPEQYHFNNVLLQDFYVRPDRRNPLLDVTFDGLHIFDGDLVSPRPEVAVTLRDDNKFLAITDTAAFTLSVLYPDGMLRRLYFSDPQLLFFPADAAHLPKKNLARVEWRPEFTQDGDYQLRINGKDAAGNASGTLDLVLRFRVITRSALSRLLNYPNPFSTNTCFVYTMTGDEPPAQFKILIMTVSGRVVREVSAAEFGPMYTGTHKSDFCWDGRDQFGDPLANGVYLYKVVATKSDGTAFELLEESRIDGYFQHGFGKMVLMR